MKIKNNASMILWVAGAAILVIGLYRLLRINTARKDIDLEPAPVPSNAHPYFEPRHHRPRDTYIPKNHVSDHRTHVGNGPGERNQIGGRASGKKARF